MRIFAVRILAGLTLIGLSGSVVADESCLQSTSSSNAGQQKTQLEMNRSSGLSFVEADKELNRVYQQIRTQYSDQADFLQKLKLSQRAWIKLRDADMEVYYPAKNKVAEYGSAYSGCVSRKKADITVERIKFLQQWLQGAEEGDVCAGSVKPSHSLTKN